MLRFRLDSPGIYNRRTSGKCRTHGHFAFDPPPINMGVFLHENDVGNSRPHFPPGKVEGSRKRRIHEHGPIQNEPTAAKLKRQEHY